MFIVQVCTADRRRRRKRKSRYGRTASLSSCLPSVFKCGVRLFGTMLRCSVVRYTSRVIPTLSKKQQKNKIFSPPKKQDTPPPSLPRGYDPCFSRDSCRVAATTTKNERKAWHKTHTYQPYIEEVREILMIGPLGGSTPKRRNTVLVAGIFLTWYPTSGEQLFRGYTKMRFARSTRERNG